MKSNNYIFLPQQLVDRMFAIDCCFLHVCDAATSVSTSQHLSTRSKQSSFISDSSIYVIFFRFSMKFILKVGIVREPFSIGRQVFVTDGFEGL